MTVQPPIASFSSPRVRREPFERAMIATPAKPSSAAAIGKAIGTASRSARPPKPRPGLSPARNDVPRVAPMLPGIGAFALVPMPALTPAPGPAPDPAVPLPSPEPDGPGAPEDPPGTTTPGGNTPGGTWPRMDPTTLGRMLGTPVGVT